jgi:hypothetical protein
MGRLVKRSLQEEREHTIKRVSTEQSSKAVPGSTSLQSAVDGSVDKSKASIAGQLYNFALRAVSVTLKAREQEELVGRLEQLEEHLESQRQGYGSYGA